MQITLAVLTDELLSASELSRYNIDIAALSETRLADEGSLNEMASGYTFFWKGLPANSRRIHAVRFSIRTWWLSKATEIKNYADANMAHQFYQAIKAVYGPKSHSTNPVRTEDGITLIKNKDILSR